MRSSASGPGARTNERLASSNSAARFRGPNDGLLVTSKVGTARPIAPSVLRSSDPILFARVLHATAPATRSDDRRPFVGLRAGLAQHLPHRPDRHRQAAALDR